MIEWGEKEMPPAPEKEKRHVCGVFAAPGEDAHPEERQRSGQMTDDGSNALLQEELAHYKRLAADYKLLIDTTFETITIADGDGHYLSIQNCLENHGVTEEKLVGKNCADVVEMGLVKESVIARVLKSRQKEMMTQDTHVGKKFLVTGIPIFDQGELVRIVTASQDISRMECIQKRLAETETLLEWYRSEALQKNEAESRTLPGRSAAMRKVLELASSVSQVDATVLLTGETGVGKSTVAHRIHTWGPRRDHAFVAINCGAIPENLLESEFFGYVAGAFTGAGKNGKKGHFENADQGTIFLDEIGEIPLHLQVKLLHVLEKGEILPVGGTVPLPVNVRILAATNKNLGHMVKSGKFRKDLYYRLNVLSIHIPPLRERKEDLLGLADHFMERFNQKYCRRRRLSAAASLVLLSHSWPGNIRELENTIERLAVTNPTDEISEDQVMDLLFSDYSVGQENVEDLSPLRETLRNIENQIYIKAYKKYKSTRKIAAVLKVDQSTVVKKLQQIRSFAADEADAPE